MSNLAVSPTQVKPKNINNQSVFRSHLSSEGEFTVIKNKLLQDERISDEVRGLICKLLSRPKDWEITVSGIIKSGKAGKDKVYRMIKEAKLFGYLVEETRSTSGPFDKQLYAVSDDADLLRKKYEKIARDIQKQKNKTNNTSGKPGSENDDVNNSLPEKTFPEKTFPENPPQQSRINNKVELITNSARAKTRSKQSSFELKSEEKVYDPKKFKNGHKLPEYWTANEKLKAWARNGTIGASDNQINEQAEAFCDYHWAHGKTMKNWDLAFRNWMRNAKTYGKLKPSKYSKSNDDAFRQMQIIAGELNG